MNWCSPTRRAGCSLPRSCSLVLLRCWPLARCLAPLSTAQKYGNRHVADDGFDRNLRHLLSARRITCVVTGDRASLSPLLVRPWYASFPVAGRDGLGRGDCIL